MSLISGSEEVTVAWHFDHFVVHSLIIHIVPFIIMHDYIFYSRGYYEDDDDNNNNNSG